MNTLGGTAAVLWHTRSEWECLADGFPAIEKKICFEIQVLLFCCYQCWSTTPKFTDAIHHVLTVYKQSICYVNCMSLQKYFSQWAYFHCTALIMYVLFHLVRSECHLGVIFSFLLLNNICFHIACAVKWDV